MLGFDALSARPIASLLLPLCPCCPIGIADCCPDRTLPSTLTVTLVAGSRGFTLGGLCFDAEGLTFNLVFIGIVGPFTDKTWAGGGFITDPNLPPGNNQVFAIDLTLICRSIGFGTQILVRANVCCLGPCPPAGFYNINMPEDNASRFDPGPFSFSCQPFQVIADITQLPLGNSIIAVITE